MSEKPEDAYGDRPDSVDPDLRDCESCGEPAYNERLCRDCDIERLMAEWPTCACGALLLSDCAKRMGMSEVHEEGCREREA